VPTDPHAFLLCGPSLAGKSTASERIAAMLGAEIISADSAYEEPILRGLGLVQNDRGG